MKKIREKLNWFIAFHLPKQIVYFAAIRLVAFATCGKYDTTIVPELSAMDAIKRYEDELK